MINLLKIILVILIYSIAQAQNDSIKQQFPFPKIIWTFWDNGYEGSGLFTKLCLNNIQYYATQSGWQLNFVTLETLPNHLSQESMIRMSSILSSPHYQLIRPNRADIYRFFLLYEHGGMWTDINTFLFQNFTWIQQVYKQTTIKNKIGHFPDYLGFTMEDKQGFIKNVYDKDLGINIEYYPGLQAWAFFAKKKCKFIEDVLDSIAYTLSKSRYLIDKEHKAIGLDAGNSGVPYFTVSDFQFQIVLQKKQMQIEANPQKFKVKYAVQYYKVWTIKSQYSALAWNFGKSFNDFLQPDIAYDILKDQNLEELARKKHAIRLFFKIPGRYYRYFQQQFSKLYSNSCSHRFKIFSENSIFSQHLFKFSQDIPKIQKIKKLNSLQNNFMERYRICSKQRQDFFPLLKVIWVYQDNENILTSLCLNNIIHYAQESQWEVRMLSQHTFGKFISAEGQAKVKSILEKNQFKQSQINAIYKIMLMYEKGGLLIESNTLFVNNLTFLQRMGHQIKLSQTFQGMPQFLGFRKTGKNLSNQMPNLSMTTFASKRYSLLLGDILNYISQQSSANIEKRELINYQNLFSNFIIKRQQELSSNKNNNKLGGEALKYYKVYIFEQDHEISYEPNLQSTHINYTPLFHQNYEKLYKMNKIESPFLLNFKKDEESRMVEVLNRITQMVCFGELQKIQQNSLFNKFLFKFSGDIDAIDNFKLVNFLGINYQNEQCSTNYKNINKKQKRESAQQKQARVIRQQKRNYQKKDQYMRKRIIAFLIIIGISTFLILIYRKYARNQKNQKLEKLPIQQQTNLCSKVETQTIQIEN